MKTLLSVGAALALIAAPASAATFQLGDDYGNPVFAYGGVSTFPAFGSPQTPFVPFTNNCGGIPDCTNGYDQFYLVLKRGGGVNSLLVHPAPFNYDYTVVQFTAPTAGLYQFNIDFERGNPENDGALCNQLICGPGVPLSNGVRIYSFTDSILQQLAVVDRNNPTFSWSTSINLSAGQIGGFAVDSGPSLHPSFNGGFGSNFSDSMHVSGSIGFPSAVPEPASWAMLIAGFGIAGATMRRRRVTAAVA
jgi:hypothetical protein